MLYPLTFHPIFKGRVWGGRALKWLYQKELPANVPIGESWEITDRPDGVSVVANGPLAGKDVRWLMEHHARQLLGPARAQAERFPLLIKILDAKEKLSLQVHPPAAIATRLGGEPKTEMWYIAHAEPGAELYVGLRRGVTRAEFERKIKDGTVSDCFHRLPVKSGDAMFLPSGRVHGIGAGIVILEIQQNSDTTYRVFDWNRLGLDGKPRELHVEQSLQCIDFNDFEPNLVDGEIRRGETSRLLVQTLANDPLFLIEAVSMTRKTSDDVPSGNPVIIGVVEGHLRVSHVSGEIALGPGRFCLIPAGLEQVALKSEEPAKFLRVRPGP